MNSDHNAQNESDARDLQRQALDAWVEKFKQAGFGQIEVDEFTLRCTNLGCPEQYDALFPDGTVAGYLRLRHNVFTVHAPDVAGELVYRAETRGGGEFEDDERHPHLEKAVAAIKQWWAHHA